MALVTSEDFYLERHQRIWNAVVAVDAQGKGVDTIRVGHHLADLLKEVGDWPYLAQLADRIPAGYTADYWIGLVKEYSAKRRLRRLACETAHNVVFLGIDEALTQTETQLAEIREMTLTQASGCISMKHAVSTVFAQIESSMQGADNISRTGFERLDAMVQLTPGKLCYLAARPSIGKTALALNFVEHLCVGGSNTAIFSMEMLKDELILRQASARARIDAPQLLRFLADSARQGFQAPPPIAEQMDRELPMLQEALAEISNWPCWVNDDGRITLSALRAYAKKLHRDTGSLQLIVIDYIQLMKGEDARPDNRQGEIEEISRGLKELAKELPAPIVCLAQLNRETEKRKNQVPRLSDLRDSGALEADADIVLLLHRERDEEGIPSPEGSVIVAKNRGGKLGTIPLQFDGPTQRFREGW